MNSAIDRITLDVHSSAVQGNLRWKMGDTARCIMASFTDNGKPWEISPEYQASVYFKKPDGKVVWGACYNAGTSVYGYDILGDETAVSGKLECEFRVYNGDKLLTSPRFSIIVDETVYDENAIYSENRDTFLTNVVNEAITATTAATAVAEDIAAKAANGEFDGKDGNPGKDGEDGKSAYEYALEGGYSKSEEDFSADIAKESIPADITSLGQVRGIGDEIKFPIQDTSAKLKYFTWGKMRNAIAADTSAAIEESHKTALVEAAYAVSDSSGLYYAFLPEGMKADGVLALQSDIPVAVAEAIEALKASGELTGKDGTKWFTGTTDVSGGGYPVIMVSGAVKGDYYLCVTNGNVAKAGDQYWQYECNIKGPAYTLTEADKADIVADVLEALPNASGVSF